MEQAKLTLLSPNFLFAKRSVMALETARQTSCSKRCLSFNFHFIPMCSALRLSAAGILLLVGRFWDAVFDPFMGVIADRTETRWGKFRPWILWSAVPFAVIFVLAFTTPHLGIAGKIIYAYITYVLLMTVYSVNNTPYSALNGVITGDVNERTSLSSFRFFFSMAAALIVQGLTLPLVDKFGGGDVQKGWSMTIGVFAIFV